MNEIVSNSGIHNPFNANPQTSSHYSNGSKPSESTEGDVYIWKDDSDVFHVNGWNTDGNDVLPTDLIAIR